MARAQELKNDETVADVHAADKGDITNVVPGALRAPTEVPPSSGGNETLATVFLDEAGRPAGLAMPHLNVMAGEPPNTAQPQPPRRLSRFLGGIVAELVTADLISERRAVALALRTRETGESILRVLANDPSIGNLEVIYEFLATRCGTPLIRSKGELVDRAVEAPWLPMTAAEQRGVILLSSEDGTTAPYAAIDPFDLLTRDWIARCSGKRALPLPVLPGVFLDAVSRLRVRVDGRGDSAKALIPIDISWNQEQEIRGNLENCDIPLLVDFVLNSAYEQNASDIHIEPVEDGTIVRARIDGILHEECRLPVALHPAITSRIKVLAGMDVAERRRPQDGRITAQIRRVPLDIRVSTFPTVSGEKVVMRLLDEKALRPKPEQLGMKDTNLRLLLDKISAPHGLVMLSGPTGSGKTTTLYSCLSAIDRQRRNILTIEDPVEYRLSGIHQMQVSERIGLTFANGLRTILRQDPDVIMVGECRDAETAKMAIQASLTGHVVFSTIHANNAIGVISRLLDMDIDPFLVATALTLPIGQRLMRTLCTGCQTTIDGRELLAMLRAEGVSEQKMDALGIRIEPRLPCLHAPGCDRCRHTGYVGRQAVYEMFEVTEEIRELIVAPQFSADQVRKVVRHSGMSSMVENALQLVEEGRTNYAEVIRVFGDGVA